MTIAALFDYNGIRYMSLGIIASLHPLPLDSIVMVEFEVRGSPDIYYPSHKFYSQPRSLLVSTRMDVVDAQGGLRLISPPLEELGHMPLPSSIPTAFRESRRTHIGGLHDIHPPIWRGTGRAFWYMANRYFSISSHSIHIFGTRLELWPNSYVTYVHPDGFSRVAEVLYCLLDSTSGDPYVLARSFFTLEDIRSFGSTIPDTIHSSTGGRRSRATEIFYSTSFLIRLHHIRGISLTFFLTMS